MKNCISITIYISVLFSTVFFCRAQKIAHNEGLLLTTSITLGNQNDWLKVGVFAFGAVNYKGIAAEGGISVGLKQLFKRHTINTRGISKSYEVFGMLGGGQNDDLLGASVSTQHHTIFRTPLQNKSFAGIGFGFEQEFLPHTLNKYALKRGKFLLRFANNNTNVHLAFLNDFKAGKLFYGEGTDYGETVTLIIGVTQKRNDTEAFQVGYGITLFTPPPNYSLSPRNPINSDNGRKNVWYLAPDTPAIFYANSYAYGSYQSNQYSLHSKLGKNSAKMGANIQNKLHDGFGLNPRFPWDTTKKDRLYYEFAASLFYNTVTYE